MEIINRKETWLSFESLMKIKKDFPYRKTFNFDGRFINQAHEYYQTCPRRGKVINTGIYGSLLRADALKIYELSYFSPGNVLDLGTNRGLSSSIMYLALKAAKKPFEVHTIDISANCQNQAKKSHNRHLSGHNIQYHLCDASKYIEQARKQNQKFGFVFIDHAHTYDAVYSVCQLLGEVLLPGAFCLFHDFTDKRNKTSFGVFKGIEEGLPKEHFEFYGSFGCAGLYRLKG